MMFLSSNLLIFVGHRSQALLRENLDLLESQSLGTNGEMDNGPLMDDEYLDVWITKRDETCFMCIYIYISLYIYIHMYLIYRHI